MVLVTKGPFLVLAGLGDSPFGLMTIWLYVASHMTEPWGVSVPDAVPGALSRNIYHNLLLYCGGHDGQPYTLSLAPDGFSLRCLGPWNIILTGRQLRAVWEAELCTTV